MRLVGIDLGTTNSVVAYVDDAGLAHAIAGENGSRIVPSVVWFPAADGASVEVGSVAKERTLVEPANVAALFKRGMGAETFLPNGEAFTARGKPWRSEELSSVVIVKLVEIASQHLGASITDVVVTVPAYFGEAEKAATRQAGELAGMNVHLLPAEPMAAAVAHGLEGDTGASTILVFDLGGGTFDVTVLSKQADGELTAIAHNGSRTLGGADFDRLIVERIASQAMSELGSDLWADAHDVAEAFSTAEELKKNLSSRPSDTRTLIVAGKRLNFELTQAEFESMISEHVEDTELTVESCLDAADMTKDDIDSILLVGGSSRIPAFQTMLSSYFGKEPISSKNLDEDVARGAALMGTLKLGLAPEGSALSSLPAPKDVSAHPIGIVALNDQLVEENVVLLEANAPIPTPEPWPERRFGTAQDGQTQIELIVNEGDDSNLQFVDRLGTATGHLGVARPRGYPIDIRIGMTGDGILTVFAHDGESGARIATIEVDRLGAMSADQIRQTEELLHDITVI